MSRIVVAGLSLLLAAVVWWQFLAPRTKLRELRRASGAVAAACVQGEAPGILVVGGTVACVTASTSQRTG
jgi:hypothetical protein